VLMVIWFCLATSYYNRIDCLISLTLIHSTTTINQSIPPPSQFSFFFLIVPFYVYPSCSNAYLLSSVLDTNSDIDVLKAAIEKHGAKNADGNYSVSYGVLFEQTANTLEALNGTLRSAKRHKIITFEGELLMHPKDKDVPVVLIKQ